MKHSTKRLKKYLRKKKSVREDYNVIVDAVDSTGGSHSQLLVRLLAHEPFKTTKGNIRLGLHWFPSLKRELLDDASDDLREWLNGPATNQWAEGAEYTTAVPFKCRFFNHTKQGIMTPQKYGVQGRVALLLGPSGGSNLDHFAATMLDNNIADFSVGIATGGHSNTWEFSEEVKFPETSVPVVEFMWSVGHAFRPNGSVLEGNAAEPAKTLSVTPLNYKSYRETLLNRALRALQQPKSHLGPFPSQ
jgi:hypothetical protein